jgi:regulator of protease activity HflC (stomatin/prohibitin superfamily)
MRLILIMCLLGFFATSCGYKIIDTGHRGVLTDLGKVEGEPLGEGLHFYNPFTKSVVEMNVQEQKAEGEINCYSSDNQQVDIKFTVVYYPDPSKVGLLYQTKGLDYFEKIGTPAIIGGIKDIVGKHEAGTIAQKRELIRGAIMDHLKEKVATNGLFITGFDMTNVQFKAEYENAVEAKVVATQRAQEAVNKTVQIREEKAQAILKAEGEAQAIKIRAEALAKNPALVQYEAVQKWNGELPNYMMGNSVPFISIDGKKQVQAAE